MPIANDLPVDLPVDPPVALPIDEHLPRLLAELGQHRNAVIVAPPGAGKTTRVPPALLSLFLEGEIVVLEPRRLAAQLSALRVAEERHETLGQTVGVQLRFESVVSENTRLRFVTLGVLLRQLVDDPQLSTVRAVIFDEFHERHFQSDVLLALLRKLQNSTRPDLHLVVMSATIEAQRVADFLKPCPVIESPGRSFPVQISHLPLPPPADEPLPVQVRKAIRELCLRDAGKPLTDGNQRRGDVLVFLPGSAEIRRCQTALAEVEQTLGLEVLPLHGDMPLASQREVVWPHAATKKRRVILTTNIAETSLTIHGVTTVIDSGLHRQPSHAPDSFLPTLQVAEISRASAAQRAGRAGRTQPGECLRLYTKHDHDLRPAFERPEIQRMDLCEPLLALYSLGFSVSEVPFFEPLPEAAVRKAQALLRLLDVTRETAQGATLTPLGDKLARFPLHPRLSKMLVECAEKGLLHEASVVAAMLGEKEILKGSRAFSGAGRTQTHDASERSDVCFRLDAFLRAEKRHFSHAALSAEDLDAEVTSRVAQTSTLLRRLAKPYGKAASLSVTEKEVLLEKALFGAFSDRVARRRTKNGQNTAELLLCQGGTAVLAEKSVVRETEWMVLVEAERRGNDTLARLASSIEPDWLLDVPGDFLVETEEMIWNESGQKAERRQTLRYGQLVLDETRTAAPPDDERTHTLLFAYAEPQIEKLFSDAEEVPILLARAVWLSKTCGEVGFVLPSSCAPLVSNALSELCRGKTSFASLRDEKLSDAVLFQLGRAASPPVEAHHVRRWLDEMFPETYRFPTGYKTRIHYSVEKPPWIETRLQNFFGVSDGPTLAKGRVPLVLHLLAPNQRAVQVTTDLAGFWERHYPSIRRELLRKYPRHAWPEDPLHATPPQPAGTRFSR